MPIARRSIAASQGKWLLIDAQGGFGIFPTVTQETKRPDVDQSAWSVASKLRQGEEIWISVFPPRPYNWKRAYEDLMAHEGNEPPYTYPGTALIQSAARYCKVMVVHSWFWPGGDRAPWKIPTFVPQDPKEFFRVRADLELDDFLRWTLSGYNISNAVGYWVYTGSTGKPGYVRQAPTREHIDAALRQEVRLPRTEIGYELNLAWEPNDGHLAFFDKYYYGELARMRAAREK